MNKLWIFPTVTFFVVLVVILAVALAMQFSGGIILSPKKEEMVLPIRVIQLAKSMKYANLMKYLPQYFMDLWCTMILDISALVTAGVDPA